MAAKSAGQMAEAIKQLKLKMFDAAADGAVVAGVNDGLKYALRVAVTQTMITGGGKHAPVNSTKLTVRSGNLRRDIRVVPAKKEGEVFIGGLEAGGSGGVPYAAIHEFGGTIKHPGTFMISYPMHWKKGTQDVFAMRVKAHDIKMPARPYMGPALKQSSSNIMGFVQKRLDRLAKTLIP